LTINTVVIGARGYTGSELLPLLVNHPECEIVAVGSSSSAGEPVGRHVHGLAESALDFTDIRPSNIEDFPADLYILALPNGRAARYVDAIESSCPEAVIIDLSADYRFDNEWVYGQPERFAQQLSGATRIANPGCYATGMQLALLPVLEDLESVPVAFGVSGYSGAGKTPSRKNDTAALQDNLMPYSLADHVHEKEVTRHLGREVRFLPHVAPFFRGISLTLSASLASDRGAAELVDGFDFFYRDHRLIHVSPEIPEVTQVQGTHQVLIGGFTHSQANPRQVAWVCVLDNLLKGAATQAVQNMNLAYGLDSLTGLVDTDAEEGPGGDARG